MAVKNWFDKLSDAQKKAYIKAHPNSKYAKRASARTSTEIRNINKAIKKWESHASNPDSKYTKSDAKRAISALKRRLAFHKAKN
jgi:outer membrane protein assembly factor BamD (BamD/ComL family)